MTADLHRHAGARLGPQDPTDHGQPAAEGRRGRAWADRGGSTLESFQQTPNSCMDCHAFPIASPQLLAAAGPHGLRKVVKPEAGAAAPYSFLFASETNR